MFQIMMDKKQKRAPVPEGFSRQGDEAKEHLLPVRTQIEKFEEKARLNFNKSRPAPQPPGRSFVLPKIGNYQPKSLQVSNFTDENVNKTDFQKLNNESDNVEEPKKFMIIGDKDTPITIHQSSDITDTPPENEFFPRFGSDNPVYEPDELSQNTTEKDLVLNFEKTKNNPLFQENEENSPRPQITSDTETVEKSPREGDDNKVVYKKRPAPPPPVLSSPEEEEEYPAPDYEPDPDYDDEEEPEAMDVNPPTVHSPERHLPPVKRENEGEDFSKYMHDSEDEDYFSDNIYTWRNKIKYKKKPAPARPVSQPAGKKNDNRSKPKEKPKQNQVKSNGHSSLSNVPTEENIRKTIRDFSFTDSKIGYDDRTVKSTTAMGRYMKRGKDRLPLQQVSSGSYEDFLRTRYNENGSNGSGDSGHETGDDFNVQTDIFRQSQPKQFKSGGKQSVWEKLTWRFKRHSRGYAMT